MIWLIRADLITLDDIYNIKPINSYFIEEKHHSKITFLYIINH